jgi:hypothetical protein
MKNNFASALHTPAINTLDNYCACPSGVWQCLNDKFSQKISNTPVSVVDVFAIGAGNAATVYLEYTDSTGEKALTGLALASILDNQSPMASLLEGLGISIVSERQEDFRTYLRKGIDIANQFDPDSFHYSQPRQTTGVAAMEIPAWKSIKEWLLHYLFPFDDGFVCQTGTKASVHEICAEYGAPDLAPFVEGYLYCAWRHLFLDGGAWLYRCGENDYCPGDLHVACCHDVSCDQVLSYSYGHSGPQIGDAIDFRQIQKPVVPKQHQEQLDSLWETLKGDNVHPVGKVDYEAKAGEFVSLMVAAIGVGQEPQLRQGLNGFSTKSFIFDGATCTKSDWDVYKPADALKLVCHAVIWSTTGHVLSGVQDD